MKHLVALFTCILCVSISSAQESIYQGSFEANSYWTTFEGDWEIKKDGDEYVIYFKDNFEAKKAPDLKVFLHKLPFKKIDGDNASHKADAVLIAQLSKYKGAMSFKVPASVELTNYQSLIVHCEKYSKLWGGAALK